MTADAVTTVSPTYAGQLLDPACACGLGERGAPVRGEARGVLNGIDVETIDPRTAKGIAANFGPDDLAGKAACKGGAAAGRGLEVCADAPVVSIVSRLVGHKGTDLGCRHSTGSSSAAASCLCSDGGDALRKRLPRGAGSWPGRVSAQITYSDGLARRVYAGSDLLPCPRAAAVRLSQMIAMRYGTVPHRAQHGRPARQVLPPESAEAAGFVFEQYDVPSPVRGAAERPRCCGGSARRIRRAAPPRHDEGFQLGRERAEYLRIYESISGR